MADEATGGSKNSSVSNCVLYLFLASFVFPVLLVLVLAVPADAVYSIECDIFAPCALGGVLNASTISQLKCRVVAGGANNQLASPGEAESLRARGIFYAPDYVINVGGAMAILGLETQGWTQERAEKEVIESVRRALRQVLELAATEGITTDAAAQQIARERLSATK